MSYEKPVIYYLSCHHWRVSVVNGTPSPSIMLHLDFSVFAGIIVYNSLIF